MAHIWPFESSFDGYFPLKDLLSLSRLKLDPWQAACRLLKSSNGVCYSNESIEDPVIKLWKLIISCRSSSSWSLKSASEVSLQRRSSPADKTISLLRSYSLILSLKRVVWPKQKSLEIWALVAVVNSLSRFWTSFKRFFTWSQHFWVYFTDIPDSLRLSAIVSKSISDSGSFLGSKGCSL